MWTAKWKASRVIWLEETKSVKHVQRRFRREYNLQRHYRIPDFKRIVESLRFGGMQVY